MGLIYGLRLQDSGHRARQRPGPPATLPAGPGPGLNHAMKLPTFSHLPRDTRDTLFVLAVIAWVLAPLSLEVPLWCSLLSAAVMRVARRAGRGAASRCRPGGGCWACCC